MRNTGRMSHIPNWRRNERKMALEISRQRRAEQKLQEVAELEAKAAQEGGQVVTLHDHGPELFVMGLTPCTTFNYLRAETVVTCASCAAQSALTWEEVAHTRLSHTPWPRVMPHLVCAACGDRPAEVRFTTAGAGGNSRRGVLSIRPAPERPHIF